MRALLVAVVLWLMAVGASADVTQFIPSGGGGAGRLPLGSVMVAQECDRAPFTPCFDDDVASGTPIQDAIDRVEGELVGGGFSTWLGKRHVIIAPREDTTNYVEDVDCTLATGATILEGFDGGHAAGSLSSPGVTIQGTAGGNANTITMENCHVKNLNVLCGTDSGDVAIRTPTSTTFGSDSSIENSVVSCVGLDAGQSVMQLSAPDAFFRAFNSRITGTCSGLCDATTSVVLIDSDPDVGVFNSIVFQLTEISQINVTPATGTATIEIVNAGGGVPVTGPPVSIVGGVVACDNSASTLFNPNCFEIDDVNTVLDIQQLVVTGGNTNPFTHGRFMEVIGAGTGSIVTLGHVEGSNNFNIDSIWGSTVVRGAMGCSHPVSIIPFDPDELAAQFLSVDDNTQTAGPQAARGVPPGNTDTFRYPFSGGIITGLDVLVDVVPGAGNTWTIDIMANAVATGYQCVLSGAGGIDCRNGASTITDGIPWAPGDRIDIEITPGAGGAAPALAASMEISFCFGEAPR